VLATSDFGDGNAVIGKVLNADDDDDRIAPKNILLY